MLARRSDATVKRFDDVVTVGRQGPGLHAEALDVSALGDDLDVHGDFDLLVLDTPPSRSALDFLDAPARVTGFFHGRGIMAFLRPAGLGGRILGHGTGIAFGLLARWPAGRFAVRAAGGVIALVGVAYLSGFA